VVELVETLRKGLHPRWSSLSRPSGKGGPDLPDGRAFALKTDDGAPRVRPVLMAEALRRSGVLDLPGVDAEAVRRTGRLELLGGGVPVGEIRASY